MSTGSFKNPPKLEQHDNYDNWVKALQLWRLATDVPKAKQGIAVVLQLAGKARDAVLELDVEVINSDNGIDKVLEKLNGIFKKDTIDTAYETFENFINFKREPSMNITTYIFEFERRYNKAKALGFTLPDTSLGYFLMNQAKLSDDHKKLVRATITNLELDEVKSKLRKVFGCNDTTEPKDDVRVKIEDINLAEEDVLYGNSSRGYRNDNRSSRYPPANNQRRYPFQNQSYQQGSKFTQQNQRYKNNQSDKRKLRCNICESTYHLSYNCPEKRIYTAQEDEEEEGYDVILYQSNLITDKEFKTFVVESATSAILDSGASANVTGVTWLESYISGLSEKQLEKIKYFDSNSTFRFGSGKVFKSLYRVEIPAVIGEENILISTDVVETTVPLLLSKEAMKKAGTSIDFVNDEVTMFGKRQRISTTESGHYAVSLNKSKDILDSLSMNKGVKINLITQCVQDKAKMAKKLHAQFGHPPLKKLLKLIERAGLGGDKELVSELSNVHTTCAICKEYTKPSPTPVVGLPHAERFNETVALDLKFFEGHIILHAIDHLTRFSAAAVCKSKEATVILKNLVKCWISIFGPPEKFMVDNGGEFANQKFLELAEAMNVRIITTAAYSPWSNGLVERHNATLAEMLNKVLADGCSDVETALCWTIQAKNSLDNVNGFSPAQLVFGQNPTIPTTMNSAAPALEESFTADVVNNNLENMKKAREAFIKAESSEKIKRALRHNIRPSGNNKFFTGDLVFYKRNDSRRWKGPGRVIGSESSNILIKHGSTYVRVHACCVMLDKRHGTESEQQWEAENPLSQKHEAEANLNKSEFKTSSSSEEENVAEEEIEIARDQEVQESDLLTVKKEHDLYQKASKNSLDLTEVQGEADLTKENDDSPSNQAARPALKKGIIMDYRKNEADWQVGEVIQRAGKVGGKYSDHWNVKNLTSGQVEILDTKENGTEWRIHEEVEHEDSYAAANTSHEVYVATADVKENIAIRIREAKSQEIA